MSEQEIVNKLNVEQLKDYMVSIRDNPDLGKYKFCAKNEFITVFIFWNW